MSAGAGIRLIGDEQGMSLIELLVAMLGAIVVVGAAFAIYIIALHQTTRISDRVQADQTGRNAMATIVEELHSSCLQKEFTPIGEKSTPSSLWFEDAASKEAQISSLKSSAEAYDDHVYLNGTTLIDERFPSESGTLPKEFVFNTTTPSAKLQLAQDVSKTSSTTPYFEYYEYAKSASSGTETSGVNALKAVTLKETQELGSTAKKVAAVKVNFTVTAREGNEAQGKQAAPFSNEVTLAFGLPSSEATIEDAPCQ
jgi:Tfp pilus assembly protein PilW